MSGTLRKDIISCEIGDFVLSEDIDLDSEEMPDGKLRMVIGDPKGGGNVLAFILDDVLQADDEVQACWVRVAPSYYSRVGGPLDSHNIGLVTLINRLRQAIDLDRVIGVNAQEVNELPSSEFWANVQMMSLDTIALTICKIYENPEAFKLNSIPGLLEFVPKVVTTAQRNLIDQFGSKYGNKRKRWNDGRAQLFKFYSAFRGKHSAALADLIKYRNKYAAHSEHAAVVNGLPSHQEFESFYEFARSVYNLISESFLDTVPAPIGSAAGIQAFKVLKQCGIPNPRFLIPDEVHQQ